MKNISAELSVISDVDCQLTDTRDLLKCLVYLAVSFDTTVKDKVKSVFEAVNDIPDLYQYSGKDMSKQILLSVHKKLFPKSSSDASVLEQQFKDFFGAQNEEICRLVCNLEKTCLVLQPELIEEIGQIHPGMSQTLSF